MRESIHEHSSSENHEHHAWELELACQHHPDSYQDNSDTLCYPESGRRQVNAPDSQDVGRVAFATPVFFGDMNQVSNWKQPQPNVDRGSSQPGFECLHF